MPEHPIAVAPDEFELMLTAFAAHRLPILNRMCWVDPMSGLYFIAPEDEELAKAS